MPDRPGPPRARLVDPAGRRGEGRDHQAGRDGGRARAAARRAAGDRGEGQGGRAPRSCSRAATGGWGRGASPCAASRSAVRGIHAEYDGFFLPLHGAHQAAQRRRRDRGGRGDADRPLDEDSVREALDELTSPGRLEVVADRAHGGPRRRAQPRRRPGAGRGAAGGVLVGPPPPGAGDLLEQGRRGDRRGAGAARRPRPRGAQTAARGRCPAEELAFVVDAAGIDTVEPSARGRGASTRRRGGAEEDDLVVVTGSLYTVAAAREHLARTPDYDLRPANERSRHGRRTDPRDRQARRRAPRPGRGDPRPPGAQGAAARGAQDVHRSSARWPRSTTASTATSRSSASWSSSSPAARWSWRR